MPMTSMAIPGSEMPYETSEPNPYGYGLKLCLDDKQCAALGITTPPAVGTVMMVMAKSVVVSTKQERDAGDKPAEVEVYLELQITDIELKPDAGKSIASTLYGD